MTNFSSYSDYDREILYAVIDAFEKHPLPVEIGNIIIEMLRKEKPNIGIYAIDDLDMSLQWQIGNDCNYISVYNESTGYYELQAVPK